MAFLQTHYFKMELSVFQLPDLLFNSMTHGEKLNHQMFVFQLEQTTQFCSACQIPYMTIGACLTHQSHGTHQKDATYAVHSQMPRRLRALLEILILHTITSILGQ